MKDSEKDWEKNQKNNVDDDLQQCEADKERGRNVGEISAAGNGETQTVASKESSRSGGAESKRERKEHKGKKYTPATRIQENKNKASPAGIGNQQEGEDELLKIIALRSRLASTESSNQTPAPQSTTSANSSEMVGTEQLVPSSGQTETNLACMPNAEHHEESCALARNDRKRAPSQTLGPDMRPGAYSAAPGEAATRINTFRFSTLAHDQSRSQTNQSGDGTDSEEEEDHRKLPARIEPDISPEEPDPREQREFQKAILHLVQTDSQRQREVEKMSFESTGFRASQTDSQRQREVDKMSFESTGFSALTHTPELLEGDLVDALDQATEKRDSSMPQLPEDGHESANFEYDAPPSPLDPPGSSGDRNFLIEATLVTSERTFGNKSNRFSFQPEGAFIEAEAMSSSDVIVLFLKTPKGAAMAICTLLSMAGMVLGLVLGLRNANKIAATEPPTAAPTTLSPTQAPTQEFGLDLLPKFTREAIRKDPESPQAKALQWILNDPNLQEISTARKKTRMGLATLYYSTNGDKWTERNNWMDHQYGECEWFQFTRKMACINQTLINIDLESNALSGTIPPEIALIEGLARLSLAHNSIIGPLPSELGMLSNSLITLDLADNPLNDALSSTIGMLTLLEELNLVSTKLRGPIPTEIGRMQKLVSLSLSDNKIFGSIPSELGNVKAMRYFDASRNFLSGLIPSEIGLITSLGTFVLASNPIQGTLITELGQLTRLTVIDLGESKIRGSLPSQLGRLTQLDKLILHDAYLEGGLPTELFDLKRLRSIQLMNNRISGSIPSEIGNLSGLRSLYMNNNQLDSSLPTQLGVLEQLTDLVVSQNKISGPIPEGLTKLPLETLDLSYNMLTGELAPGIFSIQDLYFLGCGNNLLSGVLPTEVGLASNLDYLSLDYAGLKGTLPSQLGQLVNLRSLYLAGNSLSGTIPSEIGRIRVCSQLYLYANNLNGTLPTEIGALSSLLTLHIESNELSGPLPSELGKVWQMQDFFFYSNAFTGFLPTELGNLEFLEFIYMGSTNITGLIFSQLPTSLKLLYCFNNVNFEWTFLDDIGRLSNLEDLYLEDSNLKGTIPPSIGFLTSLSSLYLGTNSLTGSLPSELGLLRNAYALGIEDNDLSGRIPDEFFQLSKLQYIILGGNNLTGSIPTSFCASSKLEIFQVDCSNVSCSCCSCK